MLARLRPRLTYANVTATVALMLALGGAGAYAASKVGSGDIKDNAIRSRHIKNGEVGPKDLSDSVGTSGVSRKLIDPVAGTPPPVTLAGIDGLGKVELACTTTGASFEVAKDSGISSVGTTFGFTLEEDPANPGANVFTDAIHANLDAGSPTRAAPVVAGAGSIGQFTAQLYRGSSEPKQFVGTFVVSVVYKPSNHPNKCLAVTQWWNGTSKTSSG
jgi:hypothetical protein